MVHFVYIVLSYATYVFLAVTASALLFGVGAVVVTAVEALRVVRRHQAVHETVRDYSTGR